MTLWNSITRPESTLVLIVGHCAEFEKGRTELGDRQLYDCFCHHYGARQVVFLRDGECTRKNCQRQLQNLLDESSRTGDTFVFYYGGHGTKQGFETIHGIWLYQDVIQTIQQYFRGNQIWCLIDCCYSGCFVHPLLSTRNELTNHNNHPKSWLCLMSTEESVTAGEEWCMTATFSNAMKGRYPNPNPIYEKTAPLLIQDVVELMEDHHAILKNDWLQATLIGTDIDPMSPFPFIICSQLMTNTISKKKSSSSFSSKIRAFIEEFTTSLLRIGKYPINNNLSLLVTEQTIHENWEDPVVDSRLWKRQVALQKGTPIYCKWKGGIVPQLGYLFPLYYPATLMSDRTTLDGTFNTNVEIEFNYRNVRWDATVDFCTHVVPVSYIWMVMEDYLQAHRTLFRQGRYLDLTIPPGTKVWALYHDDNVVYTGKILHNHEIPWHKVHVHKFYDGIPGPYLWLEWDNEGGNWDIIPKHHCRIIQQQSSSSPTVRDLRQQKSNFDVQPSPAQAILAQMESMGKSLLLESPKSVKCLWDGQWYPARTCQEMPSWKTLWEHLQFENCRGAYYYVYWVEEDSYSLMPESLIQRN
jgi:hypothetical protein